MGIMRSLNFLIAFFAFLSVNGQQSCIDAITSREHIHDKVVDLSSPDFYGRLSGSAGYDSAAAYVADFFQEIGLKPAFDTGFLQEFKVEFNEILQPEFLKYFFKRNESTYQLGKDYIFRGFSGAGHIKCEMVFCGYGISMPEAGYDDYEGMDVTNKIVLAFKYNPGWKIDGNPWAQTSIREKTALAKEKGALGIVFLPVVHVSNPQKPIGSVMHGKGVHLKEMPQLQISLDVADQWFSNTGLSLFRLQDSIDQYKQPFSRQLNGEIEIMVHTNYSERKYTYNVAGILEGSDPVLKNEFVILGAHLDHVGQQAGKVFFPGANDNASGVASIMTIAEALSTCKTKPKRSIVFVAFAAEENGLLGSRFFMKNTPVQVEQITAMLNMDCVAYGDSIMVGSGKSFPALYNLAVKNDAKYTNAMVKRTWRGGGADAQAFFESQIPTLYFVTTNSYAHLHLPTDLPQTLNKELHRKITMLAYYTLLSAAGENYKKERPVIN